MGFEPMNNGFANRRLSPLGHAAGGVLAPKRALYGWRWIWQVDFGFIRLEFWQKRQRFCFVRKSGYRYNLPSTFAKATARQVGRTIPVPVFACKHAATLAADWRVR